MSNDNKPNNYHFKMFRSEQNKAMAVKVYFKERFKGDNYEQFEDFSLTTSYQNKKGDWIDGSNRGRDIDEAMKLLAEAKEAIAEIKAARETEVLAEQEQQAIETQKPTRTKFKPHKKDKSPEQGLEA